MTNINDFQERFGELVSRPDSAAGLTEAAFCIAGARNADFDPDRSRQQLAHLGESARFRLPTDDSAGAIAHNMCRYLHGDQGFRGNDQNYYQPENSFLDRVLETRRGIPISLALIYIGVGQALGLNICGVGFPGHFLVKLQRDENAIIDPFNGQVLSEHTCAHMLLRAGHPRQSLQAFLKPASNNEILGRMLTNLKVIYSNQGDYEESLSCTEWRLMIDPLNPQDLFDKGQLLEQLGRTAECVDAYETFLRVVPESEIRRLVVEKLQKLGTGRGGVLH